MRYLVGFLILCAVGLAVLSLGCGQDCPQAGCSDEVRVGLAPEIEVTYDVTFVLDGEPGAFTCLRYYDDLREAWLWRPQPYRRLHPFCSGKSFVFEHARPVLVEITVSAEDGSWNGSLTASPTYEAVQPNGADCPPTCHQAGLTMTNDVGAFEVQP